jgi:hypothetical protein
VCVSSATSAHYFSFRAHIPSPLASPRRLQRWRGLIGRKSQYRRGLHLLNLAWRRLKYKLAYLTWPGRRECLLARQMHSYLTMKHKDRIALVDVQEPKQIVEVVSFVSKRRPTFVQRAVNLGILRSKAELDGLQYYQTLCCTILQSWQGAVRTDISTRSRAFAVRAALQARLLRMCTMKWVLLTPKTSYRRVVWMTKPPRRAHDAYTHRRMLLKEYNTVRRKADKSSEAERRIQVGTLVPCCTAMGIESTCTRSLSYGGAGSPLCHSSCVAYRV